MDSLSVFSKLVAELNTQPTEAVLFDLDGTLIDSVPDLAAAIDLMLQGIGKPPVGEVKVNRWVGNGASALVKRALADDDQGDELARFADELEDDEYATAYPMFEFAYAQRLTQATGLYNGVLSVLADLNAAEITPVNFGTVPDVPVDPTDSKSYNHTSSVTTYDSQGNSHISSMYYVSDSPATSNQWNAYFFVDGVPFNVDSDPAVKAAVGTAHVPTALVFDANGSLDPATGINGAPPGKLNFGAITSTDIDPGLNVAPLDFNFDFASTTQYSANFSVQDLSQDGLPAGNLTGISISDEGVVSANFSNGGSNILGKVALTRFANPQGLTKMGDTSWRESVESGEAVAGQPKSGSFGSIQSGALESSNVDLSAQLVHLIIAQQAYQANAQTITTEKTIMQTILNA